MTKELSRRKNGREVAEASQKHLQHSKQEMVVAQPRLVAVRWSKKVSHLGDMFWSQPDFLMDWKWEVTYTQKLRMPLRFLG